MSDRSQRLPFPPLLPWLQPATASAHTAAALSALRAAGGARGQKVVVQNLGEAASDFNAIQVSRWVGAWRDVDWCLAW